VTEEGRTPQPVSLDLWAVMAVYRGDRVAYTPQRMVALVPGSARKLAEEQQKEESRLKKKISVSLDIWGVTAVHLGDRVAHTPRGLVTLVTSRAKDLTEEIRIKLA